jgi:hypothetical protein
MASATLGSMATPSGVRDANEVTVAGSSNPVERESALLRKELADKYRHAVALSS